MNAAAFLIILFTTLVWSKVTFYTKDGKLSFSAPTMDPFELPNRSFNRTKCLLSQARPSIAAPCTFDPAVPLINPRINSEFLPDYDCTVALLDLLSSNYAGCHSVNEAVIALQNTWVPSLTAAGYPSSPVTVLVILPRVIPGLLGGPVATPYLSHSFSVPDGQPPLDTLLIPYETAAEFAARFRLNPEVVVDVYPELGPWNETFLSPVYRGYKWFLFVLNCIMVTYSMYRLFLATIQGTVKMDQRTVVFVGGMLSAIMFSVSLMLRRQTQLFFILELVSSFFFAVAFYMLLSLWSGILSQIQRRSVYSPLRVGIYVALLIAVVNLVFGFIWLTVWPGITIGTIHDYFRYVVPSSQAIVGILFLFYGIRFQLRKNDYNTSADTRRALSKLAWLAVLGFFTFIVKAVSNFTGGEVAVAGSVGAQTAVYVASDIASTARAFAILMVLGVRLPEQKISHGSSSGGSSRTFLSWGGWSRGWRRALYGSKAQQSSGTSTMNDTFSQSTSGLMSTSGYTASKGVSKITVGTTSDFGRKL